MDEAMERARKALDSGRRVDAVVLAMRAVEHYVRPDREQLQKMRLAGFNSVFGGPDAVARWMASLPRQGSLL